MYFFSALCVAVGQEKNSQQKVNENLDTLGQRKGNQFKSKECLNFYFKSEIFFFSLTKKDKLSAFWKENFPTVFELFCYLHDEGGTKKNLSQCGEYEEVIFAVSILLLST